MNLAVIFGGQSTEHKISIVSATSVIYNLDKSKYNIFPIYIGENGLFYKYTKNINDIKVLKVDDEIKELEVIDNIFEYLKNIDVIFPVLHGLYGEDGTIQGLFELLGKKYVGCKVLASAICMDKVYAKIMFEKAGLNVAKGLYLKKENKNYIYIDEKFNKSILNKEQVIKLVTDNFKLPIFVKPSNSGSSFGVNKIKEDKDIIKYLEEAFSYDEKVLVEEAINGKEVECAVLGNEELIVSSVGEIVSAEEFYSFDSKYKNSNSKTLIPARIDDNIINEIKELAKKAYLACDCKGLSRIDFFVEENTNKIIINEINTLPGFTEISMYPKLIENIGISYSELLDRLIKLAN